MPNFSAEFREQQPAAIARLGLLNIMPSSVADKTEYNWHVALGDDIELLPVRFDDDVRLQHSDTEWLARYIPIGEVCDDLDGIVVTGANAERLPDGSELSFESIHNIEALRSVIDWAESDARLAIYSCLSSHVALSHLFDVQRKLQRSKTFGVFCHDVIIEDELTDGLELPCRVPHSRWGTIHPHALEGVDEIDILIEGFEPGWLLAKRQRPRGLSVFLQGHPEYGLWDLHEEYARDVTKGGEQPTGYYTANDPRNEPDYRWEKDCITLFENIARSLVAQKTLA